MAFWSWSRTAATNANIDPTINMAEGMAPSAVNDGIRALMARAAEYRDDIAGGIVSGGSSTSYTVSSFQGFDTLAHLHNQMIAFVPNTTSANAVGVDVTLSVDSLGQKPIRIQPSVALPNGTLILGTPYIVTFNNTDGVFYLQNMVNPYVIPLAAGMDFWGTSTPNSSFAFPTGQAISRTTYATLFSIMSTTYGAGDGSTTFNLPDKTGRVSAMKEAAGTRLTTAVAGIDGGTIGAAGGGQSHVLTTAEIPSHTHANTLNDLGHTHNYTIGNLTSNATNFGGGINNVVSGLTGGTATGSNNSTPMSITNAAQGGGGAHAIVQPTIVCNYILRII